MITVPLWMFLAATQPLTADKIMGLVGGNQDRALAARAEFVYNQDQLVRMMRSSSKIACEVHTQYIVTPTPEGTKKERTLFAGKKNEHGKLIEYDGTKQIKQSIDSELCQDFTEDFASDKKGKDGINRDMFPLAGKELHFYNFRLEGEEDYRGMPVYRITFEPKEKWGERPWEGEAVISKADFQPVVVTTRLSIKIPIVVRTALGTNIEHLGFKVVYQKFDEGLWFPVSYGGEFKVRVLFFYARRVGISIRNDGFTRAKVDSQVKFAKIE